MAFDFYRSNISFLKENSPFLYYVLTEETPRFPDVKVSGIDSNGMNFYLSDTRSKCLLNSLHHKDEQMSKLIDQVARDAELLVVFGFECGFLIEEAFKQRPSIRHIIVIEPCLQLFKEVLASRDIKPVFMKNKSVSILLNRDTPGSGEILGTLMRNERHSKMAFVGHITYRTMFPNMYEQVMDSAREFFFAESANLITMFQTLQLYSANMIKNQKQDAILAEGLFEQLRRLNCPVIIVSAGPSLIKDIGMLPELRDKAFIVAVGTAIRVLDSHGIKPHLRVAIDGFPSECVFEDIDTQSVPLLFSDKMHFNVLPHYHGLKYRMVLDLDWIVRFFYHETGYDQTLVRSGYSVANLALDLFARLGFKKVILMGQDLCFQKNRLYAEGARDTSGVDPDSPGVVRERNSLGEEVYSTIAFLSMKNLFEWFIRQHPQTEFINTTEAGLPIAGTTNMRLLEAMKDFKTEPFLDGIHERVDAKYIDKPLIRPALLKNYEKFLRETQRILEVNEERVDYLKTVADYENSDSVNGIGKKLELFQMKLNGYDDQLKQIDLYRYVINPALEKIIHNLRETYNYKGEENHLQIQSLYKTVLAEATEIQQYALLFRELRGELEPLIQQGADTFV